jgi:hypothetical protein
MENNNTDNSVQFNQAIPQITRMDEIFRRIDLLSLDLFKRSPSNYPNTAWNYDIVYQDLTNLYGSISSELSPEEKTELEILRIRLRNIPRTNPPFIFKRSVGWGNPEIKVYDNFVNQDRISDNLLKYRLTIERAMKKHGFNNPSKSDVTKSAVKF